jgi:hypothetical protein
MDGLTERLMAGWGRVVNVCMHCFKYFIFSKDVIVQLYIMNMAQKVLPFKVKTNLL